MLHLHRFCALSLLLVSLMPAIGRGDAQSDKAWADADAKVAAAKLPFQKAQALLLRATVPMLLPNATRQDWEKVAPSLDEAFVIINKLEPENQKLLLNNGTANKWRGDVAAHLDNHKGAVSFFDKAEAEGYVNFNANTKSKGSDLYVGRAASKKALYDFKGALNDYDKALNLLKNSAHYQNRAALHFEMGDWESASADWKRATELGAVNQSEDDDDFLDSAIGTSSTAKKPADAPPFDRALLPFNKAIAANPNSAAPFLARAQYRLTAAREKIKQTKPAADVLSEAIKDYSRIIQIEPKNAEAWRGRGLARALHWQQKLDRETRSFDEKDVLNDYAQAIRLAPKDALTRYETGQYFLNRSAPQRGHQLSDEDKAKRETDLRNAIKNFSTAIYFSPDASGDAHYFRAYAERQLAKPDSNAIWHDYNAVIAQNLKFLGEPLTASERDSALSAAHIVRGKINLSRGQNTAALADFNRALALDAWNSEGNLERGKLRVLRGEYEAALQDFHAVITTNPRLAEAWLWRASAHDGKGESEKARAAIEQALKLNPALSERVRGTRYDAQNPSQKALAPEPNTGDSKIVPPGTALEHKEAGNALNSKGDKDGALAEYNKALLIDPNFADAYNNRASIYMARDQYDLAITDFQRALEIDPQHRLVYNNRADLWAELNETEKQRADLNRAVEYADTPERKASAYIKRAQLNLLTDKEKSTADMLAMMALQPKDAAILEQAGRVHIDLKQYEKARDNFRQALETYPDWAKARFNLALTLAALGDTGATDELQKALLKAKPNEVAEARRINTILSNLNPDSTVLKTMKERLSTALPTN